MASIWSKTKLSRAEREEGLGLESGVVERGLGRRWESEKEKEGLGFMEEERWRVLVSRREKGR